MINNQPARFGCLPSADWHSLVQLSRQAGFALDVILGRMLLGVLICSALLSLSTWSGPRSEQTQRRFDQDATLFKIALQTQAATPRQGDGHQNLLSWLDAQSNLPLRVRLYEENHGFPAQLLFDSQPATAVPNGPVWMHGISHRIEMGGRTLTAVLSPPKAEQAEGGSGLSEVTVLLMVMGLALVFPFVLPALTMNIVNLLTATHSPHLAH
jgi:hypothetical protein